MTPEETPDMVYGRLREATHVSTYSFERACAELEWLLTEDRWRQVGPGYTDVNVFLRSAVDLSGFHIQDTRPALVQMIKALQPEASNRAIAEAIGVAPATVDRDVQAASHEATRREEPQDMREADDASASDEAPAEPDDDEEVIDADETDDEDELPAFMDGEGWTMPERQRASVLFFGLPAALQWTVQDLLGQPGICVPDCLTMLEHTAAMDEAQRAELVRLQASRDAYERSCAITYALNRPPPPHPRVMLLYEARRELEELSRRVERAAARYPDLLGTAEVSARAAQLAALAQEAEALIEAHRQPGEVLSA